MSGVDYDAVFVGGGLAAALLLRVLQQAFLGPPGELRVAEARPYEVGSIAPLLALSLVIGIVPRWLLDLIEPFSAALVTWLSR